MTSQALHELDGVFPADTVLRDALDTMDGAGRQEGSRLPGMSPQTHRQAAQHRSGRLRTIEALRRPRS